MDSRAALSKWRSAVTDEEIARIRSLTEDVARRYYTDEELDWLYAGAPAGEPSPLRHLSPAV
jgi:hypothetical protein